MEKQIITFSANEQRLIKTGGIECYASNIVSYIEAHFDLGANWSGYDSVRAVWSNDNNMTAISTVLDTDGVCVVPFEVLTTKGIIKVNLVGSISVSDVLTDRLTTFPCEAVKVTAKAKTDGSETQLITPSQFEQFVAVVISEVEKVTGMTAQAETLPAGSQATARYENGILYLGIPQGIQGERGETGADGNGIASVVYNADYSLTLVFDNGERFTTPSIRGERGPAGADGRDGTNGRDGADGVTPNISIGNVETLEPSEDAYVTRRGADDNPIFDFGIPKGDKGDPGEVTMSQLSSLLPTDTASGAIASFPDGQSIIPALSVKAQIEPIQSGSGTPSPDNVRPISGHTECVTVDDSMYGGYIEFNQNVLDALASGSGTASANYATIATLTLTNDMFPVGHKILAKGKMKSANGTNVWLAYSPSNLSQGGNVLTDRTSLTDVAFIYSVDSNYTGRRLRIVGMSGDTATWEDVMLFDLTQMFGAGNEPTTIEEVRALFPKDYYEYNTGVKTCVSAVNGTEYHTYTTNLGRTVYGGTLDVVTGELVVDRAMKSGVVVDANTGSYTNIVYGRVLKGTDNKDYGTTYNTAISNMYETKLLGSPWDSADNIGKMFSGAQTGAYWIGFPVGTTLAEMQSITANNVICYELATPQTYQLDPTEVDLLLGQNNVWTDCGSVEVTYKADVGLYIDKKLSNSGTRSLSMGLTKSATAEAETETEPSKTEAEAKAEETKTEPSKTETETR